MSDRETYEYEFDPDEANNTAASIYALVREGGRRVLDLGSGPGIVAGYLARNDDREVTCLDLEEASLTAASDRGVAEVIQADLDAPGAIDVLADRQFDVIILADVLEHLRDPAELLAAISDHDLLASDGFLVVSIPNANHEGVLAELLAGEFRYRSTGLLDDTHIRWFTRSSFTQMANRAGYTITRMHRTQRSLEQSEFAARKPEIDPDLRSQLRGANPDLLTYQFVFRLEPSDASHELAQLRAQLDEAADERHRQVEVIGSLERELARLERELASHESIEAQMREVEAELAEIGGLRNRVDELEARLADERALKDGFQRALVDLRNAIRANERQASEQLRAQREVAESAVEDARAARVEVASLLHQIDVIHASETWRMGRFLKRMLAPVVWVVNRLRKQSPRSEPPAPPSSTTSERPSEVTYSLTEDTDARHRYEAAVVPHPPTGERSVYFAVYTTDFDEGRGDIYVAVGLGTALAARGWDVHYLPRGQWREVPSSANVVVAMLPGFEPLRVPPGVRSLAWIRNETDTWLRSAPLAVYDGVLASSEQTAELVRSVFPGPVGVLPIAVDLSLFVGSTESDGRDGAVSTVNQWGREREIYTALRRGPIGFPLAIFGHLRGFSSHLEPFRNDPVSYFALPSLYRQAGIVLDDMNHTTKPYGNVNSRLFEALAAGSMVVTNSSSGLAQLGLEGVPSYTEPSQLKRIVTEVLADPTATSARAAELQAIVRERHGFDARAASFDDFVAGLRDASRVPVLAYFPDYRATNPYLDMLYSRLDGVAAPVPVSDISKFEELQLALEYGHQLVVHIHWTAPVLGPAESLSAATDRAARFIDDLAKLSRGGAKIVWTVHNSMPHESAFPEVERTLRQQLAELADTIHIMSEDTIEHTAQLYHLPAAKLVTINHASYVDVYPSYIDRHEARRQLGLSEHHRVVLYLGAIRPYKGVDLLVDAFQRVSTKDPDLRLLIAGRPAKSPEIAALEARCLSTPNVVANFHEVADEDLQIYFKAADVAALPYRSSLNSGAALLAASFGVPIIAPRMGALSELLEAGLGVAVEPDDVDSLAEALLSLEELATPEKRAAALEFARERRPETMARPFAELIEGLL